MFTVFPSVPVYLLSKQESTLMLHSICKNALCTVFIFWISMCFTLQFPSPFFFLMHAQLIWYHNYVIYKIFKEIQNKCQFTVTNSNQKGRELTYCASILNFPTSGKYGRTSFQSHYWYSIPAVITRSSCKIFLLFEPDDEE